MPTHVKLAVEPWAPVAALVLRERGRHFDGEQAVGYRPLALLAATPSVEPACSHLKDPTQNRDRVVGLLRLDEGEPQWFRLAKKAVASSTGHRYTFVQSICRRVEAQGLPRSLIELTRDSVQRGL